MPYHISNKISKNVAGFSIGETLLAMFVLTMGILILVAYISRNIRIASDTQNIIIATELAQEGVELMRNVRDNHLAISGNGFDPSQFPPASGYGRIDYDDTGITTTGNQPSVTPSNYYLLYNVAAKRYSHAPLWSLPVQQLFSRYIYVKSLGTSSAPIFKVTSFVYWNGAVIPPNMESGLTSSCTIIQKC